MNDGKPTQTLESRTTTGPRERANDGGSSRRRWWIQRLGVGVFVFYAVKGLVWLVLGAFVFLAGNCAN